MKDEEKIIEEKLKSIDKEKMAAAVTAILTDSIKQAADNIASLSPKQLEDDVKQVALLLSRQKNSTALLNMASDLNNAPDLLSELAKIAATIELHSAKNTEDKKEK